MAREISTSPDDGEMGEEYWRTPLDLDNFKIPHGKIHIIKDRCKGCEFCIEFCPNDVLVLSDEFNPKGYHPPRVAETKCCIACRLCELICPEFAIYITENESLKKQ